jgi:hypothetical protein
MGGIIMDMMLHELLDAYEFADIEDTFTGLYKKTYVRNAVGYEEVFETLKDYENVIFSDYCIQIDHVQSDRPYENVTGKRTSEDFNVSLSFTPWKEWLGMRISPGVFENYTGQEILCHCLWEMTFYGYNEKEIQKVISEIESASFEAKRYASADAMMEELEDMEEEAESREILEKMLKNEIESSSSSDDR